MADSARILEVKDQELVFSGRLDADSVSRTWSQAVEAAGKKKVDVSRVDYCDGAGLALLWELKKKGGNVSGLKPEFAKMLEPFAEAERKAHEPRKKQNTIAQIGEVGLGMWHDLRDQMVFVGQMVVIFGSFIRHPRALRWGDMWLTVERAGVQALAVVGMISFLTGMIMAFQSAPPLKQFGVDIFVVNLVALAMLRELGPIMTAIVLAGRSGSSFAAEIGTMKVNEEINALTTMGIDPVRFLVAPRVLAGIMITPILTIYSDFMGVVGGFLVMIMNGFPAVTLMRQLQGAVQVHDVMAGVIKSFFLGALVASIGCLRGLQTKEGSSAVGISTTRAVVSGIFLIIVADAIFAVVYYALGI